MGVAADYTDDQSGLGSASNHEGAEGYDEYAFTQLLDIHISSR